MKQIQFAILELSESSNLRDELEAPLNNGWSLQDWKIIERGLNETNQPVVFIAVCLEREVADKKRGRPPKEDNA